MKRAEHQLTLPGVEEMTQQDEKEWKELMGFTLSESALKMDMGTAVSLEEKQALWSVEDEKRMDIIGPNGNDGDHYRHVVKIGGRQQGKTHGKNFTHSRTVSQTMCDKPIPNDLAVNRGLDGYNS